MMKEKENIECKLLISKARALRLTRRSGTLRRAGVVSFNYHDNAGGRGPLNLNTSNGAISGGITNRGAVKTYTVSEVRNSWRIRR